MCFFSRFFNNPCCNNCRRRSVCQDVRMNRVDAGGRESCESAFERCGCGCEEHRECGGRMCD